MVWTAAASSLGVSTNSDCEANACILAFDVTRKITYKNLETCAALFAVRVQPLHNACSPLRWYKEIRNYCAGHSYGRNVLRACMWLAF